MADLVRRPQAPLLLQGQDRQGLSWLTSLLAVTPSLTSTLHVRLT